MNTYFSVLPFPRREPLEGLEDVAAWCAALSISKRFRRRNLCRTGSQSAVNLNRKSTKVLRQRDLSAYRKRMNLVRGRRRRKRKRSRLTALAGACQRRRQAGVAVLRQRARKGDSNLLPATAAYSLSLALPQASSYPILT